jgi:hypothetical protein
MAYKFEIPEAVKKELDEQDMQKNKNLKETEKSGIIQFPKLWANDKRAVPSALLRSALFGVVKKGRRAYVKGVQIASWQGCSIKYTGEQLMQSDQDVWMACVEACKRDGKAEITMSQRELIKLSGRKGGDTKRLWNDLVRLRSATIEVYLGSYRYVGGLINDADMDEKTKKLNISINPKMLSLFGGNVTHIDIEQRATLRGDLTLWMQGYICSHQATWRKPHFINLTNLQELCGSSSEAKEFKRCLKKSMEELVSQKIISGWLLEKDILKFWRKK